MNLAYGYIAETLQTHDELTAARINEQRRVATERRADAGEHVLADGRPGVLRRLRTRWPARGIRGSHGLRAAH